jgi:3-oxoacyl-(acyl-carrier-protein) synthase
MIQRGEVDVVLAGGSGRRWKPWPSLPSAKRCQSATTTPCTLTPVRPRDGFLFGEGAGVWSWRRRTRWRAGAHRAEAGRRCVDRRRIPHLSPEPTGRGATMAMTKADAGLAPDETTTSSRTGRRRSTT